MLVLAGIATIQGSDKKYLISFGGSMFEAERYSYLPDFGDSDESYIEGLFPPSVLAASISTDKDMDSEYERMQTAERAKRCLLATLMAAFGDIWLRWLKELKDEDPFKYPYDPEDDTPSWLLNSWRLR